MCAAKTTRRKPIQSPPAVLPTDAQSPAEQFSGPTIAEAPHPITERRSMIAEAAYYRAKQRNFEPGHELEDWLAAENEVVKSWLERTPVKRG